MTVIASAAAAQTIAHIEREAVGKGGFIAEGGWIQFVYTSLNPKPNW